MMNVYAVQYAIGSVVVLLFAVVLLILLTGLAKGLVDHERLTSGMVMALQAMTLTVVGFYFGSIGKEEITARNKSLAVTNEVVSSGSVGVASEVGDAKAKFNNLKTMIDKSSAFVDEGAKRAFIDTAKGVENALDGAVKASTTLAEKATAGGTSVSVPDFEPAQDGSSK